VYRIPCNYQDVARNRARVSNACGALALSALLVGCRAEPSRAPGEFGSSYFPMVPGARWVYSLDLGVAETEVEFEARGDMAVRGYEAPVFIVDESNRGETFGMVERAPTGYVVVGDYLARLTAIDYDSAGKLQLLGENAPAWILPLAPQPGQNWTQKTQMFTTPEGGGATLDWTGRVISVGRMRVPAGEFEDVVEVHVEYWDRSVDEDEPVMTYDDSYARGVGLIRSVTRSAMEGRGQLVEQRLVRYEFPAAPD
jgi:hypothetical protein